MAKKKKKKPGFKELTAHMKSMSGESGEKYEHQYGKEKYQHDCLSCLKESLQLAIDLEFSTIPPYLTALWSIKDELHPAAKSIREVVQEEMLHMALACNMLTAIGGQPQITWEGFTDDEGHPPRYPTPVPGGLHPGLEVYLSGLSDDSLVTFMHIELPMKVFPLSDGDNWNKDQKDRIPSVKTSNKTIGEFYAELLDTFKLLKPRFSQDRQVTGPLAYSNVGSVNDVEWAIELISHQGEGSTKSPFDNEKRRDLAHFYRFEEVFMEAELEWSHSSKIFHMGKSLPRPNLWPMGPVPDGGYREKDLKGLTPTKKKLVSTNLKKFDQVYSMLLRLLQNTWSGCGQRSLVQAYETMFELEQYAKPLMEVPLPARDCQTFGPCFRYTGTES